jgi:hypothetical protein
MSSQSNLTDLLQALIEKIKTETNTIAGTLQPTTHIFYEEKYDVEAGSYYGIIETDHSIEESYRLPEDIIILIRESLESKSILEYNQSGILPVDSNSLRNFIAIVAHEILNNANDLILIDKKINEIIVDLYRDLHQKPFDSTIVIKLLGVITEIDEIDLSKNGLKITLRQIKPEDFYTKQIIFPYLSMHTGKKSYKRPSSIIKISYHGVKPKPIHTEIYKIIAVLRLIDVCSANFLSYEMNSDVFIQSRGLGRSTHWNKENVDFKTLQISPLNYTQIISFYHSIYNVIPKYIYYSDINGERLQERNVFYSSLKVAYSHYSKALTDIARVEERIMNTVIGLESLLLHENQDNTLRFWLRGAKILSFFNYSPMKIKNTLKSAYGVRSSFVHGNDSDLNKEMIKFSKNEGSW